MNSIETAIVNKFLSEIEAAEASARATIIGDLYTFLGVVEKRISLSKAETEVKSLASKAEDEVKGIGADIEKVL